MILMAQSSNKNLNLWSRRPHGANPRLVTNHFKIDQLNYSLKLTEFLRSDVWYVER